jgi:hypothetical protein
MRKLIVAAITIVVIAVPSAAQAAPVRWSDSDVICHVTQIGNTAYGLQTALPSVYAFNMRSGIRERQKVGLQFAIDLWQPGQGWVRQYITPWYYAYAWDNFRAQAWINSADNSVLKQWEKMQWSLNLAGAWRVWVRAWYGSRLYPRFGAPTGTTNWRVPIHSGSRDGRTDLCLVP